MAQGGIWWPEERRTSVGACRACRDVSYLTGSTTSHPEAWRVLRSHVTSSTTAPSGRKFETLFDDLLGNSSPTA